jgi:signal transduction histidine kinase
MRKPAIAALTLGILLTMGAIRIGDFRSSRIETLRATEARAHNLALILSEYLTEAFAAADAALRLVALHSQRVGGPEAPATAWLPTLASARVGLAGLGAISVTDADGIIRHSTIPALVGQSRSQDFVVRQAFAQSGDGLLVSTPFLTRDGRSYIIPLGRRLMNGDQVAGVVVGSFVPAETRGLFKAVDVGRQGAIWVFHTDGVVLFREPSDVDPMGASAKTHPIYAAAMRREPEHILRGALEEGGTDYLSAFRFSDRGDLIVAVSLSLDEVLAEWQRSVTGAIIFFAVLSLTLAAALAIIFRQMDAQQAVEAALARSEQLEAERVRENNQRLAAALEREQHARQEAEAASAVKDQFLMTVSHELRTPLTAIAGWARMLIGGGLSDERKQMALQTIERNAAAQTRLVGDLLDVASVTSGRLRVNVRQVDIVDVVLTAVDTIRPAADAKHIALHAPSHSIGDVPVDPDRIQQVVWNLVSNAVKFTKPAGRVDVTVERHGADVEIAVTDTGIGIAPAFLSHVFERFRQEDVGTTRRYGGLGLGLAIVRHLVELHGGTVHAESPGEGLGATFRVKLPASASASQLSGHEPDHHENQHREKDTNPHAGLEDVADDLAAPKRHR